MYVHTWYEAKNDVAHAIADLLDFSLPHGGNYWAKDAAVWSNAGEMQQAIWEQSGLASIDTMLKHFKAEDYAFNWDACDGEKCASVAGLDSEFQQGASAVRALLSGLDQNKVYLFAENGARLPKLLALLGDKYRQAARFPMDKVTTRDTEFLKSYYADHAVYNYRTINPAQADMGNFSRSDFSHVTPTTQTVQLMSRAPFRATGVYALPGETFTVTRHDNSAVKTRVFVNTVRSGSTHQFAENGYKRPKYLQSVRIPINSGETLQITSPYGGPIQISFDNKDLPVELTFKQVGEHPFWDGTEDDARFAQQLADGHYDWAELVTPGFEVHSTLEKMRKSLEASAWGSAQALAEGTMRYIHNFPHVLAGFKGPGIDVVADIHDFAADNGYKIETLDKVKHMNADQATCGYGCSGNPYDAYWAFSPTGHGDIHELGHGLEKWRLRFQGWETHTMTNPYSYYSKSQYFKDTGNEPDCQKLPFESMFNTLQASINQTNPAAYVKANLWDTMSWSHGAGMFIQMLMTAEDNGVVSDGWHVLARLHIMEREFNRAVKGTDADWAQKRASLGFDQFSKTEADKLNQNDWLLIAVSYATGWDHRGYFDLWALPYSTAAGSQVEAFEYPVVAPNYYVSSGNGFCKGEGFDGQKRLLDGTQTWPN